MRTVRICGQDCPNCEWVDGDSWGIKTPDTIYWLFPVCDEYGNEVKSHPPQLPAEIGTVIHDTPDLTWQFPETVKELFTQRRGYFTRTTTLAAYRRDHPDTHNRTGKRPHAEAAFRKFRKRILAESLENFARRPDTRQKAFVRHGIHHLLEGDAAGLAMMLGSNRRTDFQEACPTVGKLTHVLMFDVPRQPAIFLDGIGQEAVLPSDSQTTKSPTQLRKEAKARQKGGAKTFKLREYAGDALEMIQHMRAVRDKEKAAGRAYGAIKKAINAGRDWWDKHHVDPSVKALLDEENVHDNTLRNWIQRTPAWLKQRKSRK